MPKQQFTISPDGYTMINPAGLVVQDRLATIEPAKYVKRPVQIGLHRDLTLQLHGARFSAEAKLTVDDALGLMNMLAFLVREHVAAGRK